MKRRTVLTALIVAPFALVAGRAIAATTHKVTIKGFKFKPATLEVKVGDVIEFTNDDSAPHTATAKNLSWDTGNLSRGDSANITVKAGMDTDYKCNIHPSMKGALVIS